MSVASMFFFLGMKPKIVKTLTYNTLKKQIVNAETLYVHECLFRCNRLAVDGYKSVGVPLQHHAFKHGVRCRESHKWGEE